MARGNDGPLLVMSYVDKEADILIGDSIETSGGGIFPPGLIVGRVIDVRADATGVGRTAKVTPAVDFSHLSELLILKRETGSP